MSMFTPRICTWEDLDYTSAEKLLNAKTTNGAVYNHIGSLLFRILGQESGERRIKITKDLFYNLVLFCRKNKFTPEQLTALFTIFKTLHLLCISTPYNNIDECYQLVKDFMVKHSVFRPPYSISLFTLHQVKLITDYILETYFKHFKMYKFAFTKRVLLDLCITYEKDGKDEKEEKMESDTGAISQEANETEGKEESVEQDKGEVEGTMNYSYYYYYRLCRNNRGQCHSRGRAIR